MRESYEDRKPEQDMELLSSGSFITFGDGTTEIETHIGYEVVTLVFDFLGLERPKTHKVVPEIVGKSSIKMVFYNCDDPSGVYALKPVFLGTIAQRPVWITYDISAFPDSSSKLVAYSLYSVYSVSE